MNCSRELLEGYVDEELEAAVKADVEAHLAGCRNCTETYARLREQQAAIRSQAPYYEAPAELRQSIRSALSKASAEEFRIAPVMPMISPAIAPISASRERPWRWLAIAASFLFACSLGWNLTHLHPGLSERDVVADNVLSSHVRSLIGTHLLDVVSTDQHTVKPWFNGKLDFAPQVKDFAPDGFPLIGGRIEYLSGRSVAVLVYQRRKHVINLFNWPSTSTDEKQHRDARKGFNELEWSDGSMTYWAISDLSSAELQQFKELWLK
jgi:anti-sigma factor RsiW